MLTSESVRAVTPNYGCHQQALPGRIPNEPWVLAWEQVEAVAPAAASAASPPLGTSAVAATAPTVDKCVTSLGRAKDTGQSHAFQALWRVDRRVRWMAVCSE